jgi:hypothetical protein
MVWNKHVVGLQQTTPGQAGTLATQRCLDFGPFTLHGSKHRFLN